MIIETLLIYISIGICFFVCIKTFLDNSLYRHLVLYGYNLSSSLQRLYILYMYLVVILFWPFFALALILDNIEYYINNK